MRAAIATGRFVSLCTIQKPDGLYGTSGAPSGRFTNVDGLVDIPCTAPPPSNASLQSTEVRALSDIMASELKHVLLNGYYPALEAGKSAGWVALLDGVPYFIMGAESDSQGTQTRMEVRHSIV